MRLLERLLTVGSMTDALGVYVPSLILYKGLGLVRVLVLAYLMKDFPAQYGLWGIGMMITLTAAPLLTFGTNQGLARYVSVYESRGMLLPFYRNIQKYLLILWGSLGLIALLSAHWLTEHVVISKVEEAGLTYTTQLTACVIAIVSALLAGMYHNVQGFLMGLRAYRLLSALEIFFSVIFTIFAVVALMISRSAVAMQISYAASLVLVFVAGWIFTGVVVRRQSKHHEPVSQPVSESLTPMTGDEQASEVSSIPAHAEENSVTRQDGGFGKVVRFGLAAMIGSALWLVAQQVSLFLTNREYGKADAGVLRFFVVLAQPTFFIASAAWTVVFSHVAKRWEDQNRTSAMYVLETSYKSVSLAILTLTVLIYATVPYWLVIVPDTFRRGGEWIGGLLMFFQVLTNLSVVNVLARLHERPIIIALMALLGAFANAVLAVFWLPRFGPEGAALAAGVGMFLGGGIVAVLYLLITRSRLKASTYFVFVSSAILLLPEWIAASVLGAILLITFFTRILFSASEKQLLARKVRELLIMFRRTLPCAKH